VGKLIFVCTDRYLVKVPPVLLNVDIEGESPVRTKREIQNAAYEIAFHEIQVRGGPAGFVDSWPLMSKEKRPLNALSNPNFPGVFVWLAAFELPR
jgi:hypothetical protein